MTESDKKYYKNREIESQKQKKLISKANYRGEASVRWHKTNSLTTSTIDDFKKTMKNADKEWEFLNKQ